MNAILLILCLVSPARAAVPRADDLAGFGVMIASHTKRMDTRFAAFHGCVDWHSAVHGHWALFRLARAKVKPELAREAEARLTPEAVAAERAVIAENPDFEMPYGRAWFLRLALEREAWARENGAANPELLRPMADEIAASLLAHYEAYPPTPFAGEYGNPSWALAQLRAYLSARGDEKSLARADKLVDVMLAAGSAGFDADFALPQFFSIYGNWAYLVATARPSALPAFLARRPVEDAALEPVSKLLAYPHRPSTTFEVEAHQLGLVWSRAWALKALARRSSGEGAVRFERAYLRHVEEGLKQRDRYGADYWRYGHWVPQFAVYALTDGEL